MHCHFPFRPWFTVPTCCCCQDNGSNFSFLTSSSLSDNDQKLRRRAEGTAGVQCTPPTQPKETTPSLRSINHQCVGNHHILRFPQTNKQTNSNKKKKKKEDWYFIMRYASRRNSRLLLPYRKKLFWNILQHRCSINQSSSIIASPRHRRTKINKWKKRWHDQEMPRCFFFKRQNSPFFVLLFKQMKIKIDLENKKSQKDL